MCGRFTVKGTDTNKIADRFAVELEKALGNRKESAVGRYNVAPTQEVLTVRSSTRTPRRPSRVSARRG